MCPNLTQNCHNLTRNCHNLTRNCNPRYRCLTRTENSSRSVLCFISKWNQSQVYKPKRSVDIRQYLMPLYLSSSLPLLTSSSPWAYLVLKRYTDSAVGHSSLVLNGEGVFVESLDLSGALKITASKGAFLVSDFSLFSSSCSITMLPYDNILLLPYYYLVLLPTWHNESILIFW